MVKFVTCVGVAEGFPSYTILRTQTLLSKMTRSHLINGSGEGTASAVPKSLANSGVLTPEVRAAGSHSIYEMGSSPFHSR
jgi:hypothetical protein